MSKHTRSPFLYSQFLWLWLESEFQGVGISLHFLQSSLQASLFASGSFRFLCGSPARFRRIWCRLGALYRVETYVLVKLKHTWVSLSPFLFVLSYRLLYGGRAKLKGTPWSRNCLKSHLRLKLCVSRLLWLFLVLNVAESNFSIYQIMTFLLFSPYLFSFVFRNILFSVL